MTDEPLEATVANEGFLATFSPRRFFAEQARPIELAEVVGLYVLCIFAALFLSALLVEVTGGSWSAVFEALLDGSVRNPGRIGSPHA